MKKDNGFSKWLKSQPNKMAYLVHSNDEFTYQEYLDWCSDMDEEPAGEGSSEFYEWCADEARNNYECDIDNIKYSSILKNRKFLVVGKLGLWWGNPTIMPEIFDSLPDALERIAEDELEADYDETCIYASATHHDGRNSFRIFIIKPGADISALEARIEKEQFDFEPTSKYDARFFEKITTWLY